MSDDSNQSGSRPRSPSSDFSAARDGKQQDNRTPLTEAQKRSADQHLKKSASPDVNRAEKKSAEADFQFNAQAVGPKQTKSTVEPKKEASKTDSYKSKTTGQIYTSEKAIAAARAQDQQQSKQNQSQQQQETKKHHAPAPKPQGAERNSQRGVSGTPQQQEAKKTPEQIRKEQADRVITEHRKTIAADKARQNDKSKSTDKDLGR